MALFVALTFAVAGLVAVTPLTGSSVVAQNDTGGNETGTANETTLYTQTRQAWLPRLNANLTKLLFLTTFDKTGMDMVVIHPKFNKLMTALRTTAENGKGVLDREVISHDMLPLMRLGFLCSFGIRKYKEDAKKNCIKVRVAISNSKL